jgi:cation transport ATPase
VAQLGFDEFHAEISPEEKAAIVRRLLAEGRRVAMVGDGINDAPALSAASVGISFQHGADLARESADVLILSRELTSLPRAIRLARRTMGRVQGNFRMIAGMNSALIGLGALGLVPPAVSGALHNATTILTSARSLRPYLGRSSQRARARDARSADRVCTSSSAARGPGGSAAPTR